MVVTATSESQLAGHSSSVAPGLEAVRPGVWALGLPMAVGVVPYSICYLIEDADGLMHVIDPGWASEENWDRLSVALARIGQSIARVRSITATHLHADHLGMAGRLQQESRGALRLHPLEQRAVSAHYAFGWSPESLGNELHTWGVPKSEQGGLLSMSFLADLSQFVADELVEATDILDVPGFHLEVMHTPGHSPGHVCIREDRLGIVFTGDHLLPNMYPGLGLGGPSATNALSDYLRALEDVGALDGHEALPGHGYRFRGVAQRAQDSADHHLKRVHEVRELLRAGNSNSVWETARRLRWRSGWSALRGHGQYSALQQTSVYRDFVLQRPHTPTVKVDVTEVEA